VRHGGYARVAIGERAEVFAAQLRERLPLYQEVDEPALALAAFSLARVEAAARALSAADEAGGERLSRLEQDARGWSSEARRCLRDLGATPASRAQLVKDLGIGKAAATRAAVRRLEEHLAELDDEDWSA
jgi:signal transduction histidine kinase